MKWMGFYFLGYALLVIGVILILWKTGLLSSIDPVWMAIGLVILTGVGIMIAVSQSGEKKTIEVDRN